MATSRMGCVLPPLSDAMYQLLELQVAIPALPGVGLDDPWVSLQLL